MPRCVSYLYAVFLFVFALACIVLPATGQSGTPLVEWVNDPTHNGLYYNCPCSIRPNYKIIAVTPSQAIALTYSYSIQQLGMQAAAQDLNIQLQFNQPLTIGLSYTVIYQTIAAAAQSAPNALLVPFQVADSNSNVNSLLKGLISASIPLPPASFNQSMAIGSYGATGAQPQAIGFNVNVGANNYQIGVRSALRFLHVSNLALTLSDTSLHVIYGNISGSALCLNENGGSAEHDLRCAGFCDAMSAYGLTCQSFENFNLQQSTLSQVQLLATQMQGYTSSAPLKYVFASGAEVGVLMPLALQQTSLNPLPLLATVDVSSAIATYISNGQIEFAVDTQPFMTGYLAIVALVNRIQSAILYQQKDFVTGPVFVDKSTPDLLLHAQQEAAGFPVCDQPNLVSTSVPCFNRTKLNFTMAIHNRIGSPVGALIRAGVYQAALDQGVNAWEYALTAQDNNMQITDIELAMGYVSGWANQTGTYPHSLSQPLPFGHIPDGFIMTFPDPALIRPLLLNLTKQNIPIVGVNSGYNDPNTQDIPLLAYVGQNEFLAGYAAGQFFIQNTKSKSYPWSFSSGVCADYAPTIVAITQRCQGFQQALTEAGLKYQLYDLNPSNPELDVTGMAPLWKAGVNGVLVTSYADTQSVVDSVNQTLGSNWATVGIGSFDTTNPVYPLLVAKKIAYAIDQQTYAQGYMPITLLQLLHRTGGTIRGNRLLVAPAFNASDPNSLNFPFVQTGPFLISYQDPLLAACAQALPSNNMQNAFMNVNNYQFISSGWPVCVEQLVYPSSSDSTATSAQLSKVASNASIAISALLLGLNAAALVFILVFRKHRVIHAASPPMIVSFLLGTALVIISALLRSQDQTVRLCNAELWTLNLGLSMAVGVLILKSIRIYVIFDYAERLRSIKFTDGKVFLLLLLLLLAPIITIIVHQAYTSDQYVFDSTSVQCVSSQGTDGIVVFLVVYQATIIASGAVAALLVRHAPALYHESSWIGLSTYNLVAIGIIYLLLRYASNLNSSDPKYMVGAETVLILFGAASTMLLLTVPKVISVMSSDEEELTLGFSSLTKTRSGIARSRFRDGTKLSDEKEHSSESMSGQEGKSNKGSTMAQEYVKRVKQIIEKLNRHVNEQGDALLHKRREVKGIEEELVQSVMKLKRYEYELEFASETGHVSQHAMDLLNKFHEALDNGAYLSGNKHGANSHGSKNKHHHSTRSAMTSRDPRFETAMEMVDSTHRPSCMRNILPTSGSSIPATSSMQQIVTTPNTSSTVPPMSERGSKITVERNYV